MQITGLNKLPASQNVTPADCSLAICIPLDREQVIHQLENGTHDSFVNGFREQRKSFSLEGVWRAYEVYADLVNSVIRRVQQLNVCVKTSATLDDFHALLSRFKVTTIVAHWKPARFMADDILDPEEVLKQVEHGCSSFQSCIAKMLSIQVLPDFLNLLIGVPANDDGNATYFPPGYLTTQEERWYIGRRYLEQALPGMFRGGASVEFADGWHSIEEILSGIPETYSMTLDLTVCNSNFLAELIRRKCSDCIVLSNEAKTPVDFRFAVYEQVIRSLARKPEPYEDAVYRIRKEILKIHEEPAPGHCPVCGCPSQLRDQDSSGSRA